MQEKARWMSRHRPDSEPCPAELLLDITRGEGADVQAHSLAVEWSQADLEQLLRDADTADEVTIAFDRNEMAAAPERACRNGSRCEDDGLVGTGHPSLSPRSSARRRRWQGRHERSGENIGAQAELEVGRPPGLKAGERLVAPFAINFPGLRLDVGGHVWELLADDNVIAQVPFPVRPPA
jgi:hypothetical protein